MADAQVDDLRQGWSIWNEIKTPHHSPIVPRSATDRRTLGVARAFRHECKDDSTIDKVHCEQGEHQSPGYAARASSHVLGHCRSERHLPTVFTKIIGP